MEPPSTAKKRARVGFKYNRLQTICWCPQCGNLDEWAAGRGWPNISKDNMRKIHSKLPRHQKSLALVDYGRPNYQKTQPLDRWKSPGMKKIEKRTYDRERYKRIKEELRARYRVRRKAEAA